MAEDKASKIDTFQVDWERAKVPNESLGSKAETRTDDKFGQIVTDSEREIILKERALTTAVLADTIHGLEDKEAKRIILSGIVQLGPKEPGLIKRFYSYTSGLEAGSIASYADGSNSDYLSIACGLINTIRQLKTEGQNDLVRQISDSLVNGANRKSMLPAGADTRQAITTIIASFDQKPV